MHETRIQAPQNLPAPQSDTKPFAFAKASFGRPTGIALRTDSIEFDRRTNLSLNFSAKFRDLVTQFYATA